MLIIFGLQAPKLNVVVSLGKTQLKVTMSFLENAAKHVA
jgi:hypothetical protein